MQISTLHAPRLSLTFAGANRTASYLNSTNVQLNADSMLIVIVVVLLHNRASESSDNATRFNSLLAGRMTGPQKSLLLTLARIPSSVRLCFRWKHLTVSLCSHRKQ